MPAAHEHEKTHTAKATKPGVSGEIAASLEKVTTGVTELKASVAELHEKLRTTRAESIAPAPADIGDLLAKKEAAGEIATQGQIDMLALIKSKLEQIESMAKGAA